MLFPNLNMLKLYCEGEGGKKRFLALAGVAQLVCLPVHPKVAGLLPGQGTCLGCEFDAQPACVCEATDRSFFFPSPLLKNVKIPK